MLTRITDNPVVLPKERALRSLQYDVERIMEIHRIIRKRWPRFARALFQGNQVMKRVRRRMKPSDIDTINILLSDMSIITNSVIDRQQLVASGYPDLMDRADVGLREYYRCIGKISSYINNQKCLIALGIGTLGAFGVCAYVVLSILQSQSQLPWFFIHISALLLGLSFVNRFFFRTRLIQDVICEIMDLSQRNPSVSVSFLGWVAYDKSREAVLVRLLVSSVLFSRPSR